MTFYFAHELYRILTFMTFTLWCLTPKYTIISGKKKKFSAEVLVTYNEMNLYYMIEPSVVTLPLKTEIILAQYRSKKDCNRREVLIHYFWLITCLCACVHVHMCVVEEEF